jgi:hypothetical protein
MDNGYYLKNKYMSHQKSSDYQETIIQYNVFFSYKMGVLNEKMCKKKSSNQF